eukprot:COSAG02_NODE_27762_length_603_cov_0.803571_1_plen_154_part_10
MESVTLINETGVARYSAILGRLMKQLRTNGGADFTEAERSQLAGVLGITAEQLSMLVEASSFMLEQFVYNAAKAEKVKAALAEIGFSDDHVRCPARLAFPPTCPAAVRSSVRLVRVQWVVDADCRAPSRHIRRERSSRSGVRRPRACWFECGTK